MRATTWPIGLLPYGIMARNTEKYRSTVDDPGLQIGGVGRGGGGVGRGGGGGGGGLKQNFLRPFEPQFGLK